MIRPLLRISIIATLLTAGSLGSGGNDFFAPSGAADSTDSIDESYVSPGQQFVSLGGDSTNWTRTLENRSWGVGEYLEFSLSYGLISAGWAVMKIPEIIEYDGRSCYKIVSIAHSNDFVSMFYPVRDTVESYIDAEGIYSHYFRKHLREGGYKVDRITNFDQRRQLAITGADTVPTFPFVQDVLSSLYYIRIQELVPGKDILIDNHTDRKNYPLKVIVHGRQEIEVPAGKFKCIVVEPVMRHEGIFKAKGRITIWLTDDRHKMPVKMQSEVYLLGSISAKLKKFTRGEIGRVG